MVGIKAGLREVIFDVVGSHEHGNEPFGSMSVREFLKYMRNSEGKFVLVHAMEVCVWRGNIGIALPTDNLGTAWR
jgi:hypothetical protein